MFASRISVTREYNAAYIVTEPESVQKGCIFLHSNYLGQCANGRMCSQMLTEESFDPFIVIIRTLNLTR